VLCGRGPVVLSAAATACRRLLVDHRCSFVRGGGAVQTLAQALECFSRVVLGRGQ
jgi:hypothetical protein